MAKPTLSAVPSELPEPPYAAETRAKGFKFDLDLERIYQSKTWLLATPPLKPWLLRIWSESWRSLPVGSFEDDDELIAARIEMPQNEFAANRNVLMRGWRLHSDSRLYHPVITELVHNIVNWRQAEKNRKKKWRESRESVVEMSHGTDAGQTRDRRGTDAGRTRDSAGRTAVDDTSSSSSSTSTSSKEKKERTSPRIGTNPVTGTETANRPKPIAAPVTVQPPTDLDPDLWHEFLAIRKKLKAQNTPRALELLKSKIERIKAETGETPNAIVERSIESSWKTVYPANSQKPNQATTPRKERDVW